MCAQDEDDGVAPGFPLAASTVAVKGGLGENVDAGFVEMVLLLWQGASAGR